ncbi:glycosyltransferase N-terminal domain-containing protein [Phaeobacter sp. QD34_3]|uniref:3-deoxy-D-manno-octulosonic acid transferase n=1 Tax=unclassified Phaeobacter TaxID=2621772 RepID=UPI00237FAF7F|nr:MULTISPECIES: glycosyltransferase N-terminal domain-containing protein [unclassified Phaeobacter]MDE4132321.1 glycosyltransferase N-terminal domain-containing protein [Phaeobacter sp. QD34_3]MDE4135959.1 glycosyltransferase N-terminal domain-containing protein [Phaeobacter sp. QD34_24]MDE4173781.1 glycosyltransferase N-terminal domain-containing protein [Phaeobacter sp. PT47_59]
MALHAHSHPDQPSRPDGELLWVHATTPERYLALCDLGTRLKLARPDLVVLATWEADMIVPPNTEGCDIAAGLLPIDQTADVRAFLDHWQPDFCIWSGGRLRRTLLRRMREQEIDALLVDITEEELPSRTSRWLPDQRKRMLEGFSAILTPDPAVRVQLLRTGLPSQKVQLAGRLRISTTPPGCNDDDLEDLHSAFGSRPVWLAAHVRPDELPMVLEAHRIALRLLHRLILVLSPEGAATLGQFRTALRDSGLQFADWETGEETDDFTQVLLTDGEDLGLWYRLAPVCLMGGSLLRGREGHSPLDAAALGSAILHGPGTVRHQAIYAQLAEVGAAECVYTTQELAEMVLHLSAPDMAAEMALAGWQAVTEGAEMTDQLIEHVQDLLDAQEDRHAAT